MDRMRGVVCVVAIIIAALAIQGNANPGKAIEDDTELFLNFLKQDVLPERYRSKEYFKKIVSKRSITSNLFGYWIKTEALITLVGLSFVHKKGGVNGSLCSNRQVSNWVRVYIINVYETIHLVTKSEYDRLNEI